MDGSASCAARWGISLTRAGNNQGSQPPCSRKDHDDEAEGTHYLDDPQDASEGAQSHARAISPHEYEGHEARAVVEDSPACLGGGSAGVREGSGRTEAVAQKGAHDRTWLDRTDV